MALLPGDDHKTHLNQQDLGTPSKDYEAFTVVLSRLDVVEDRLDRIENWISKSDTAMNTLVAQELRNVSK